VQNEFSGSQSTFTWDGIDNSGLKARVGAYAIFVEAFNAEGAVARFKKAVVVAGR
jgi:flagellar hook assembly protein FlgD